MAIWFTITQDDTTGPITITRPIPCPANLRRTRLHTLLHTLAAEVKRLEEEDRDTKPVRVP
jgi:hypothetical protein